MVGTFESRSFYGSVQMESLLSRDLTGKCA